MREGSADEVLAGLLSELPAPKERRVSKLGEPQIRIVPHDGRGCGPEASGECSRALAALLETGYEVVAPAECAADTGADFATAVVVAQVDRIRDELGVTKPGTWVPWFPVIDYDRCTNCKQCLSFCLFGVFAVDADDRVEVRNPDHCKTGCPACSRVCPTVAIIFPKYEKGPINGDVVRDEDVQREPVKVDVAALVDKNVHLSLRARSRQAKERFACGEATPFEMPVSPRDLERMRVELGIPDEVSLVSPCACEGRPAGDADKSGECKDC